MLCFTDVEYRGGQEPSSPSEIALEGLAPLGFYINWYVIHEW